MPYRVRQPLGQSAEAQIQTNQKAILTLLTEIQEKQARESRSRTIVVVIGAIGALFAAVRLGIIAFPMMQQRRMARRTASAVMEPVPALGRKRRRRKGRRR
jgi:hypothetical protein